MKKEKIVQYLNSCYETTYENRGTGQAGARHPQCGQGCDDARRDGQSRGAPAIFNPEDLNALEAALRLKDAVEGSTVHILTMGPQRAADIIRDAMFRGADGGYLLSGREFAGSDTLATSYALSCALRKIAPDVIFAGRQAIDGDTAQVGPQVAEKARPAAGYLCRGGRRGQGVLAGCQASSGARRRDGRVPAAGRHHGQCLGCRVPPAQCQARDEVQVPAPPVRRSPQRPERPPRSVPPRRPICRSSSGLPPTSIRIPRSSACRVRPRRSRRSRTWSSRPRGQAPHGCRRGYQFTDGRTYREPHARLMPLWR